MSRRSFLHLVPGTKPADTPKERVRARVRAMPKPAALVQCSRCGGREVMETKIGVRLKRGKLCGGTKVLICVACAIKGQRVVVA